MKKIGIDARLYSQTGVGTYLRNFLHFLSTGASVPFDFYVYILPQDRKYVDLSDKNIHIREINAPWHSVREQTVFYRALIQDQLDLMHFTYFSYPVLYKRPFIATVHDVTPLLFKTGKASTLNPIVFEMKHMAFRFVLSQQVHMAWRIITPTNAVKQQLIELYGRKVEDAIIPIYEGVSSELMNVQEAKNVHNAFPHPFFLYVGNFYPHKNVDRLLDAYQLFREKNPQNTKELFLVGPDNMFAQLLKEKISAQSMHGIYWFHDSSTEDLVNFYSHAVALINPSRSEGFGLPLLEATYFDCPVIASDIPVFKEILGDRYIAFDPKSVSDIAQKLDKPLISISGKMKSELLEKYSFESMTRATVDLYHSLI